MAEVSENRAPEFNQAVSWSILYNSNSMHGTKSVMENPFFKWKKLGGNWSCKEENALPHNRYLSLVVPVNGS